LAGAESDGTLGVSQAEKNGKGTALSLDGGGSSAEADLPR